MFNYKDLDQLSNTSIGDVGTYLVAAKLASLGMQVTVTHRNFPGVDLLITNGNSKTFSVQVKTNFVKRSKKNNYWTLFSDRIEHQSRIKKKLSQYENLVFVFVNLSNEIDPLEFYVVKGQNVKKKLVEETYGKKKDIRWYSYVELQEDKDKWEIFQ